MYKIISIKKDGVDRTDGRYPLRIGCTGNIVYLDVGECMLFEYINDQNGNIKDGFLRTSTVKECRSENNLIIVNTLNSEYTLEETL